MAPSSNAVVGIDDDQRFALMKVIYIVVFNLISSKNVMFFICLRSEML